jgi:hypothetical protein
MVGDGRRLLDPGAPGASFTDESFGDLERVMARDLEVCSHTNHPDGLANQATASVRTWSR